MISIDGEVWTFEEIAPGEAHCHRVVETIHTARSEFQRVEVCRTESYGRGLFLDGRIQHVEADEYVYSESLVHPAMTLLGGSARRVLCVGAGPGGAVRELLAYPGVGEVVQVEIDTTVLDVAREHLPHSAAASNAADPRFTLRVRDALDYLTEGGEPFDLVVNDLSEPFPGSPAARLFGPEALRAVRARLTPGTGLYVSWCGSAGPRSSGMAARICRNVRAVFGHCRPYLVHTQSYGTVWLNVIGSTTPFDPLARSADQIDNQLARTLRGSTRLYDGVTHHHMFHLPKDVRETLATAPEDADEPVELAVSVRSTP
ncbi:spermidine synthase [Streptoalloteichus tenebrarius]|uniref:Polyamine aminopropyltransferase n=1 Tax=Streptoalloteichus tenebrarius (strain ATCC 17920 / DSM 40477 / JCM 4838 / CBS 697.72 / NBRC 16177 / NCIMB 11028 / NRRL B-12390 / A12253. 1 / ISP 5477) TaxID=1933 RepID=A0ABT1HV06_STRSD|nr:hypothetical protein [Streptoalloteichus tenebrarius]MCP2259328.1 spermidine synthase [Streptoalloteichus tenebrarius]BFE99093.1 polyamine aminopropyltransferase [Streptoalloteichus tenebrarius]